MGFERYLSIRNMKRKPARTVAMALLAALMSFAVFGGSILVLSLQKGLASYEARLGADIVVVPGQARSHGTVESILLQGIPGYFYMDSSVLEKVRGIEGVEAASPQFYLASASAGCCSVSVQIIGFDPETDFSIQPWIRESYSERLGDGDVIVGSGIQIPESRSLKFFNVNCKVVAQLSETGTGLDQAVYANMDTIRRMMDGSVTAGFDYFSDISADRAISSVMVKVADGCDIERVTGDINIHVRRIQATQAKSMISAIASGLGSVSQVIGALTAVIWGLSIVILAVVFAMVTNERTKEYAILRVIGASRRMLSRQMLSEATMVSAIGAFSGILLAALVIFPFGNLIRGRLDLPYLLPGAGTILLLGIGSLLLSVLVGAAASAVCVRRITGSDTGLILREGA